MWGVVTEGLIANIRRTGHDALGQQFDAAARGPCALAVEPGMQPRQLVEVAWHQGHQ